MGKLLQPQPRTANTRLASVPLPVDVGRVINGGGHAHRIVMATADEQFRPPLVLYRIILLISVLLAPYFLK